MKRFQRIYPAVFALALSAFSLYALLDTFVIERVYAVSAAPAAVEATAPAQSPVTLSAGNAEPAEPVITPTSYVSDELTVELTTVRWNDTDVHVADVTFTDPAALQTAFARGSYGRNVTAATSETAQEAGKTSGGSAGTDTAVSEISSASQGEESVPGARKLSDEELAARPQQPLKRNRVVSKSLKAYAQSVSSADKGGVRIIE